jgi:hypothetical protein
MVEILEKMRKVAIVLKIKNSVNNLLLVVVLVLNLVAA